MTKHTAMKKPGVSLSASPNKRVQLVTQSESTVRGAEGQVHEGGAARPPTAVSGRGGTAASWRPEAVADGDDPLDRILHAWQGRMTAGLSPAALWKAYADWAFHLANSPAIKCT